jgi:hypothetical protein
VIDEAALRNLRAEERREIARILAQIEDPHPLRMAANQRNRKLGLAAIMICCLILAAWIAILMLRLPVHYTVKHWRGVWVGLDIAEFCGFAAIWVAAWKQRQILVFFTIVTGTLLLCDAWFDVSLSYGTTGALGALLDALVVEIPLALLLYIGARRLMRITFREIMRVEGLAGPVPPIWRIPLFADGIAECVPKKLRKLSQPAGLYRLSQHERR